MNRHLRSAILSIAVAATALVPVAASADPYRHRDRYWEEPVGRHQFHGERHVHRERRARPPVARNDADISAAIALGIVGLAVGAMIASSASEPVPPRRHRSVEPDYFPPAPPRDHRARNRDVVYADETGAFEPWSSDWYRACAARYRSFDARTGTYMGYDHKRRFCVID